VAGDDATVERPDRQVDPDPARGRRLLQQVEVAQDERRLREDRERVARVDQRADDAAGQPVLALAPLVRVGVGAHGDGLALPPLRRELGPHPFDGVDLHHDVALEALVETGKLTPDSLATLLLRKADWHDLEGMTWLLEHGADPNHMTHWGLTALHQAIRRDNARRSIETMLNHGGDATPTTRADGKTSVALAARRGRRDLLDLFEQRGIRTDLHGIERLIAACARNDSASVHAIADGEPELVRQLVNEGGRLLAEFAGNGNGDGVGLLLDLGVDVAARFTDGDPYWSVAKDSTALHVAAWRARHATVKLLIDRGAPVDVKDGGHRTPLALAVRACVDSFWTDLRAPDSVEALLRSGASSDGVAFPSGYAEVDELLRAHRR